MSTVRVIARMDIKGPNLVKGIHLEGLRVLGRPEVFARHYYLEGADELFYQDVVASLYGRNSLLDLVARTAREIMIPLTVGGGLRTLADIRAALRAGADKVALNTAAVARPELVREAAESFGSSTVMVAIEAIRQPDGRYLCYTDNGREETGLEAFAWAERAQELGAGELLVTSVDQEGTGQGLDLELIRGVAARATVPVIAHGGAGTPEHLAEAVLTGGADAVAVAGMLHYDLARRADVRPLDEAGEGNLEFLKKNIDFRLVDKMSVAALKERLTGLGVPCRNDTWSAA